MESKRKYFVLILFLLLALMIFAFANPIVEESTDFKDSDNKTEEVEKPEVIIDTDKEDNNNYVPVVRPVQPVQKEETTEEKEDEIDTTYEDALAAVEYAEATYKVEDVEKAKELVNKVTDTTKKGELEDRLAEVEAGIEVMELIKELEYQVAKATERKDIVSAKDYRDEKEVAKKLEALTNEEVKEALQERLDKVNKYLDDETAPKVNINDKDVFTEDVEITVEDENDVTITLTKDEQALEDTSKTSGDGIYTLTVIDKSFNETKVTFTVDGTKPVFNGLEDGKHYEEITIDVEDLTTTGIMISQDYQPEILIQNGTTIAIEGTFTLTATDEAGNSNTITVVVDKNAPTIERTSDVEYPTADEKVTIKDRYLNTVVVEGPEFAGTYTEFTVDSNKENGTIEFTFTKEGTYKVTATDTIGNVTEETFTIDKTAPVINGFEDCKYYYNTTIKPELVEANIESYTLNGEEYDGKEITEDGHYTLVATDKAGFKTTVKFAIDTTAPTITGIDKDFINKTVTPVIEDENLAYVTVDGLPFIPGQSIKLYGEHEIVAVDKAGNKTTVKFTLDNIAPKILLLDRLQYISGKYLPIKPVILEQYIETIVVKKDGEVIPYEQGQELKGDAEYEITVTDKAGNTTTVTFTMDSVSPTALVKPTQLGVVDELDLNNMEIVDNFDDLSLSLLEKDLLLSEDVDYILLKKDKTLSILNIEIPIYKYTSIPTDEVIKAEGEYILVVYDKAYNLSAVKFTVDRSAPVIKGLEEGKEYYNTDVTITVEEANPYTVLGQDVTVTLTKKNGLPKTYKANETFILDKDGTYTIKAKDIAGNETEEITFTIDKTSPVLNIEINGELQRSTTPYTDIIATVEEANPTTDTNVKPDVYVKNGDNYDLVENQATSLNIDVKNGTQYKLVYTYTDKANNTTTKEVYTTVVNVRHEVRFNKTSYEGTYNGQKHSVPQDAYYVEIIDGVETKLNNVAITYSAEKDMIGAGTYTITATAGNVSTTATYTINKAVIKVDLTQLPEKVTLNQTLDSLQSKITTTHFEGENVDILSYSMYRTGSVLVEFVPTKTDKVDKVTETTKHWLTQKETTVNRYYTIYVGLKDGYDKNYIIEGSTNIDFTEYGINFKINGISKTLNS